MINTDQFSYLKKMGIPVWAKRSISQPTAIPPDWKSLEAAVIDCKKCELHCSRTQTVFGVGHRQASLMLIGEAPGFYEDQQGEPFVGKAGQLLNGMLKAINLARPDVFIANILKCRPPNNRDPAPLEVAACTPHLNQQIALIKPQLIVALGRISAHYLLNNQKSLSTLRGKIYQYEPGNIPLIVTYHPAYLLRNPGDKAQAWIDWQLIRKSLLP